MPEKNAMPVKNAYEERRNIRHPRYEALSMWIHISEVPAAFGPYVTNRLVRPLAEHSAGYIIVSRQTKNLRNERVDASSLAESGEVLRKMRFLTELPERTHIAHEGLFSSMHLITEDVVALPHFSEQWR